LNIEANLNTIALLRPIALQIEQMTLEEQKNMRLQPGLGGPTVSIYERIIKKVYDDERGSEIIEMLYQRPATVVPVLLNRLEIKDKEWKKAQGEWNKVWRDLDDKNFYRSLDYQGNPFKSNDKKTMTAKALVTEIETVLQKQPAVIPQYKFEFIDLAVFDDIFRLIVSFMDRQNGFTKSDKQKVKQFMRAFVPMFFQMDRDRSPLSEDSIHEEEDGDAEDEDADPNASPNQRTPSSGKDDLPNQKNGKLLRGVLKRNATPIADRLNDSPKVKTNGLKLEEENIVVDEVVVPDDDPTGIKEGMKLFAAAAAVTAPDQDIMIIQTKNYSFLCNSHYYCLFRMYQVLYERLLKMKIFSEHVKTNPELGKKFNKTAVELDLFSNRFDGNVTPILC
jgi:paired amphipathic helix protein Sin3a